MKKRAPAKATRPMIVGVIASPADLRFALAMRQPPDLFELRLDCLLSVLDQLERKVSIFAAPVIITVRDPREGGANNLSLPERRNLFERFLPYAKYVDVELRSAPAFKALLARARKQNVRAILSFHDFKSTPATSALVRKASSAKAHGAAIFKVACRTDSPAQVARLIDFVTNKDACRAVASRRRVDLPRRSAAKAGLSVSAMGIGKLGAMSRLLLARSGSVLNYASLKQSQIEGQLPIEMLRSAIRR